ncbi:disintegrin and metalloproteinase domain-containing protein 9 isoform X2 [Oncorhynchus tshawytscha]|uniref:disintegrin and metalloproteinase domain-containing protein 9 isoform X2 n=1 Tax=Oncorhynchus tshawytscha TaxID=74940 RepID=UPI001C3DC0BE|nr:disintegrin and metalloproteinase domain-containing protein 9 isoform X2 [Oncorhynchus tshawytscha]
MCGKVQCTNVNTNNPPPGGSVSNQIIDGSSCVNADFNLGSDVLDPAYVKQGSPCTKGKACLDFQCVNASALLPVDLQCDANNTCNSRGVCNNQGHCHCNDGWGPPNCAKSGRGGSVDSGPAQIDYSLRDGLLTFTITLLLSDYSLRDGLLTFTNNYHSASPRLFPEGRPVDLHYHSAAPRLFPEGRPADLHYHSAAPRLFPEGRPADLHYHSAAPRLFPEGRPADLHE